MKYNIPENYNIRIIVSALLEHLIEKGKSDGSYIKSIIEKGNPSCINEQLDDAIKTSTTTDNKINKDSTQQEVLAFTNKELGIIFNAVSDLKEIGADKILIHDYPESHLVEVRLEEIELILNKLKVKLKEKGK
jgi:hypothetical protein